MELGPFVEPIEKPGEPSAVAFQECDTELGKFLQNTAGAKTCYRLNQFERITQRERDNIRVRVAEKFVRHLLLLGSRRWMEAKCNAELFDLRPERIEVTIVNSPAVDWLRTKRERPNPELLDKVLDGCALNGHCQGQSLQDYLYYYGGSPHDSQLVAQYEQVLRNAVETGDWSQVNVVRGPRPNTGQWFFFGPGPR